MAPSVSDDDQLTTTEAAALTGRSISAVRRALYDGKLPEAARNRYGRPLVRRDDVLVWHGRTQLVQRQPNAWRQTGIALRELGRATPEMLAKHRQIHVGNVRKHLAALYKLGYARQLWTGEWILTVDDEQGVA